MKMSIAMLEYFEQQGVCIKRIYLCETPASTIYVYCLFQKTYSQILDKNYKTTLDFKNCT